MLIFDQPPPSIIMPKPAEIVRPGDPRFVAPETAAIIGMVRKKKTSLPLWGHTWILISTAGSVVYTCAELKFFDGGGAQITRTTETILNAAQWSRSTAPFDGTTSQVDTAAGKANTSQATIWIGLTWLTAKTISKVTVYGSNNEGYVVGSNPSTTISLYAKTGTAPSSGTDGTLLNSITFTDTGNESTGRDITAV